MRVVPRGSFPATAPDWTNPYRARYNFHPWAVVRNRRYTAQKQSRPTSRAALFLAQRSLVSPGLFFAHRFTLPNLPKRRSLRLPLNALQLFYRVAPLDRLFPSRVLGYLQILQLSLKGLQRALVFPFKVADDLTQQLCSAVASACRARSTSVVRLTGSSKVIEGTDIVFFLDYSIPCGDTIFQRLAFHYPSIVTQAAQAVKCNEKAQARLNSSGGTGSAHARRRPALRLKTRYPLERNTALQLCAWSAGMCWATAFFSATASVRLVRGTLSKYSVSGQKS